jgi:hypothetical protein
VADQFGGGLQVELFLDVQQVEGLDEAALVDGDDSFDRCLGPQRELRQVYSRVKQGKVW